METRIDLAYRLVTEGEAIGVFTLTRENWEDVMGGDGDTAGLLQAII